MERLYRLIGRFVHIFFVLSLALFLFPTRLFAACPAYLACNVTIEQIDQGIEVEDFSGGCFSASISIVNNSSVPTTLSNFSLDDEEYHLYTCNNIHGSGFGHCDLIEDKLDYDRLTVDQSASTGISFGESVELVASKKIRFSFPDEVKELIDNEGPKEFVISGDNVVITGDIMPSKTNIFSCDADSFDIASNVGDYLQIGGIRIHFSVLYIAIAGFFVLSLFLIIGIKVVKHFGRLR